VLHSISGDEARINLAPWRSDFDVYLNLLMQGSIIVLPSKKGSIIVRDQVLEEVVLVRRARYVEYHRMLLYNRQRIEVRADPSSKIQPG
jgi:hypothetical protein